MSYYKNIFDSLFKQTNNAIQDNYGEYSPLSGFSNEDELSKNPYQQILSSQPKNDSTPKQLLETKVSQKMYDDGRIDLLMDKEFGKNRTFEKLYNNALKLQNSQGVDLPNGMNIDSTFYNRKDIYDLKERLGASGIDIPEEKKDKPGIWTRFFDLLSTPGYVVTTALHNALDGDKDTGVLKGMLDGLIGGITADSTKYKDGSDLTDLAFGEQGEDAKLGEKVGRFASGFALDVFLDPTTYLTFGTSALVKGASKKVGKEVTEEAVKGAIKGINNTNDLAKIQSVLNLDDEAKRITKIINNKNAKQYDGVKFTVPFSKIEKEIISADKIAKISNDLGINKIENKLSDTASAMWNANKSEDGIRSTLEKLPDTVLGKIFNDADIRRTMKDSPLESAQLMATKEANKQLKKFTDKVLPNKLGEIKEIKNLIDSLEGQGIDGNELASILEKIETNNYTKELDNLSVFNLVQDFSDEARKQLSLAETTKRSAHNKSLSRAHELLDGFVADYEKMNIKVDDAINDIDVPEDLGDVEWGDLDFDKIESGYNEVPIKDKPSTQTLDILEKNGIKLEEDKLEDVTDFDYKTPNIEDVNKQVRKEKENTYVKTKEDVGKFEHEIYQSVETKQIVDEIKNYTKMNSEQVESFINMPIERQQRSFDNLRDRNVSKLLGVDVKEFKKAVNELGFNKAYDNILKSKNYSPKRKEALEKIIKQHEDMESKWFGANTSKDHSLLPNNGKNTVDSGISMLQSDKAKFEKDKGFFNKEYETATDYDGYIKKIEEEYDNFTEYQDSLKKIYGNKHGEKITGNNKQLRKIADTIINQAFNGLKGKGKNNARAKMRKIIIDDIKNGMTYDEIPSYIERKIKEKMPSIKNHAKNLEEAKNLLIEGTTKGEQALVEKYYELKAINMYNPNSKYYENPDIGVNLKRDRNTLFGNERYGTKGIWGDLLEIAERYSKTTGEDEVQKLIDGTSELLDGNMASIYSKRARLNGDVQTTLRSEAQKYANQIVTGRGIRTKGTDAWDNDPIIMVPIKNKKGEYKQVKLSEINNEIRANNKELLRQKKATLPYKKITDFKKEHIVKGDGLIQKLERTIDDLLMNNKKVREYLGEDLNKKFYDLPENKRRTLMKLAYDEVEKILDTPRWGAGTLEETLEKEFKNQNKVLTEKQNKNYAETSKMHEKDFDEKNLQEENKSKIARIEARNKKRGIIGGFAKDKAEHQTFVKSLVDLQSSERMFDNSIDVFDEVDLAKINKELSKRDSLKLDKEGNIKELTLKDVNKFGKYISYDELEKINEYRKYAGKKEISLQDLKEVHSDSYKMSKLNEMIEKERETYKSLIRQLPTDSVQLASVDTKLLKEQIRYSLNRGLALKDEITYLKKNSSFYLHERKIEDLTSQEMVTKLKGKGVNLEGVNFKDKNKLIELMKKNDINVQEGITETIDKQKKQRVEDKYGQYVFKEEAKDFTLSKKDINILNNLFNGDEKILKPILKSYSKDMDIKYIQEMHSSKRIAEHVRNLPNKIDVPVKNIPLEQKPSSKVETLLKSNGIETPKTETAKVYSELPTSEINKSVTKNGSITIDLAKLTPPEMKEALEQLGIKDKVLDFQVENWKKQKAISEKAKKVLDMGKKEFVSEDDLLNYLDNMETMFGSDFIGLENKFYDNLKNKYETMKIKSAKPKTAIEILNDNADVIKNELGGTKEAKELVTKYTELMRGFANTEEAWGILKERINKNIYVPHRMSQEAMDKMGMSDGLEAIMEAFFRDRTNMKYNDPKFAKSRTMTLDGKSKTINELNVAIRKYLNETKGIDIENFFETDLTRLIIQRTYEHGDALYEKGVNNLFLNTNGTKLNWLKSKDGGLFEIIEDVNKDSMQFRREVEKKNITNIDGKTNNKGTVNDFSIALKEGRYSEIEEAIKNYKPKETYLQEEVLDKIKENALKNLRNITDYINGVETIDQAKIEKLNNALYQNLPQRALAREYKDMVKKGKLKLIYPEGEFKELSVDVAKEGVIDDLLSSNAFGSSDFKEVTLEGFEKMTLQDKNVPVFAVDSKTYDLYVKSMKKQQKKDQNAFLEVYDFVTNKWKAMATLSPGFHVRNTFGNFAQSFLDVGTKIFDPKYNSVTKAILESSDEVISGSKYTGKEANEFFENFFGDTAQISNELNKTRRGRKTFEDALKDIEKADNLKSKSPFELSRKIGDRIEQGAKRRHFGILLSEGMSPVEARDHINKYLFDYSDLTEFETNVMKRIVPFYTFMRKNMELQLNTLMEKPRTLKTAMRVFENQKEASVSTEDRKLLNENDLTKIMIPTLGGKNLTWDTNIPWFDNKSMLGSLNPIIKTPLELATNKNFTFGNDIETYDGQVKEANPIESLIGGIFGKTETGADNKKYISSKAQHVITNALPTVRTADRMLNDFNNDSLISAIMSSLGLGGQEFDTNKRTSYEVREYKELLENLEKKAQSKGINTREKLKEKEELEALLSALNIR